MLATSPQHRTAITRPKPKQVRPHQKQAPGALKINAHVQKHRSGEAINNTSTRSKEEELIKDLCDSRKCGVVLSGLKQGYFLLGQAQREQG